VIRRRAALAALIALWLSGCARPLRLPRPPAPGEHPFSVVTYNLNYATANEPEPNLEILDRADADLVVLEECDEAWEKAIRGRFSERYPHVFFRPFDDDPPGGMAVLSRLPFELQATLPSPVGRYPAYLFTVDAPGGRVQLLAVHLRPYGIGASSRRVTELREYLAALDPTLPTIVAGDFNESGHASVAALLAEHGFRDALFDMDPNATTWHYAFLRRQLDHIAHDDRLEPLDVKVLWGGDSDHVAVEAVVVRQKTVTPP